MTFRKLVRYSHVILLIKHAEPNQVTNFVPYRDVYVITVTALTDFVLKHVRRLIVRHPPNEKFELRAEIRKHF